MTMTTLLGIDLGTSSVKAALIHRESLHVVASAGQEYSVQHPQPGYAEQNPDDWWQAVVTTVRAVLAEIDPDSIVAIGLSGQMHGFVPLGDDLTHIHPAIIWADARSASQVETLQKAQSTFKSTLPGLPAAGFMATTALWLQQNQPETLQQMRVCMLPKDYLRLKLTGTIGTDYSDAASSWLFDVVAGQWARDVVEQCGLTMEQMPPLSASHQVVGTLTAKAADELGLPPNIPVATGSADLPAQALGHGITAPGTVLVTVGTGGQVFTPLDAPNVDVNNRYYVFNHNVPDMWYAQAAILAGGLSLRWLRDLLGMQTDLDAYERLSTLAGDVPAGAEGLVFLPYLAGERSPHMDAAASGLFLGLRLEHEAGHLARAVMEGVGFALKDCLALVGADAKQIVLSGGAAKSPVWRQLLADIWNVRVQVADVNAPHACIGAAILAGVGGGVFSDIGDAVQRLPQSETVIVPQKDNAAFYTERYALYQRLYPTLKDEMHRLRA
jgi:xylulokinase